MARQDDACWRCGDQWAAEDWPRPILRVLPGGGEKDMTDDAHARIAGAVASHARAVTQARLDMDRWINEGGRVPFEAAAVLRATTWR
jgi:hypothetical protein